MSQARSRGLGRKPCTSHATRTATTNDAGPTLVPLPREHSGGGSGQPMRCSTNQSRAGAGHVEAVDVADRHARPARPTARRTASVTVRRPDPQAWQHRCAWPAASHEILRSRQHHPPGRPGFPCAGGTGGPPASSGSPPGRRAAVKWGCTRSPHRLNGPEVEAWLQPTGSSSPTLPAPTRHRGARLPRRPTRPAVCRRPDLRPDVRGRVRVASAVDVLSRRLRSSQ